MSPRQFRGLFTFRLSYSSRNGRSGGRTKRVVDSFVERPSVALRPRIIESSLSERCARRVDILLPLRFTAWRPRERERTADSGRRRLQSNRTIGLANCMQEHGTVFKAIKRLGA